MGQMILQPRALQSIRKLRLSVTDRCNLRCRYCMAADRPPTLDRSELLSLEEMAHIARVLCRHLPIQSIKLTGGEPLVRHGLSDLVAELAAIPGSPEISMTTNGTLLRRFCGRSEAEWSHARQRLPRFPRCNAFRRCNSWWESGGNAGRDQRGPRKRTPAGEAECSSASIQLATGRASVASLRRRSRIGNPLHRIDAHRDRTRLVRFGIRIRRGDSNVVDAPGRQDFFGNALNRIGVLVFRSWGREAFASAGSPHDRIRSARPAIGFG